MTHLKDALDRAVCAMPLLVMFLLAAWPRQADAQEIGDITAGRHLSETWCSSCHLVEAGATSGVSNGVPTFVGIARLKSTTVLSLRAFLQTPHAAMPDLHLSRDETDDLATYTLSLRRE
jgi:mono/diheme cytochrome c family protein